MKDFVLTSGVVAEKTFIELRRLANKYTRLAFIAVSHSSKKATDRWISQMGGAWSVQIVIDEEREIYAAWGLGVSTTYRTSVENPSLPSRN
jgi:hypothetical protein